jgi:hypothetical protein
VRANGVVSFGPFILVKVVIYDKYLSAEQNLDPIKKRLFNSFGTAESDVYNASHGSIEGGFFVILKKHLYYDTRAFRKVFFVR